MDFAILAENSEFRNAVQEGLLERKFRDSLLPNLEYRRLVQPVLKAGRTGDNGILSAAGSLAPNATPVQPGQDPGRDTYTFEQWQYTLGRLGRFIVVDKPTDYASALNTFAKGSQNIGRQAGQTMNRVVRDRAYNAALSGWGVADASGGGTQVLGGTSGTLRVKRLNGFTSARSSGQTLLAPVSASNPLAVTIELAAGTLSANVVGFTADTLGDTSGPGTLSLTYAAGGTAAARGFVMAADRSSIVRSGGGNDVGDIGAGDLLTFATMRTAVTRAQNMGVPGFANGFWDMTVDPTGNGELFTDTEFQNLVRGGQMPQSDTTKDNPYAKGLIARVLNCDIYVNNDSPQEGTVTNASLATASNAGYSVADPFGGELFSNGIASTGVPIHRALICGGGMDEEDATLAEVYIDLGGMTSSAGGTISQVEGGPSITANGIQYMVDRVQILINKPNNVFQDQVQIAWQWIGDFAPRTDYLAMNGADPARYKRFIAIEHA